MNAEGRTTKATLIDGKVFVQQADGSWREAEDRTDWARVDSFTEEDIERQAEEDGDAEWFPEGFTPSRVVRPHEPVE
jgi:hypothetical protein